MSFPKINLLSSKTIDGHFSPDQILAILLKNRQIKSSLFSSFLTPPHPDQLTFTDFSLSKLQLKKAVNTIKKSIKDQQNILIYGDYDADGITSTAILWQSLHSLGAKVSPFIPHRDKDGYGLNFSSFTRLQKQKKIKYDLVITVDNGISAGSDIKKINKTGTKVIIVDHHLAPPLPPPALALLHSSLTSASVLAWFLAKQLVPSPDLGLAALGLVADCQPLLSLNRYFVYHGLASLRQHPSPGISAMLSLAKISPSDLSAYHLGFILGPQINAIGRLDDPLDALRLLCAISLSQARPLAQKLASFNFDRQSLQKEAINLALSFPPHPSDRLIFQARTQFHPGLIGLVAGHLTQTYFLPSVIISRQKNISKGSCRSIPQLNIIDTLRRFSSLFIDLGGHSAAAGFTLKTKNIPLLRQKLKTYLQKKLAKVDLFPVITVEASAKLSALKIQNIKAITRLAPFGIGNSTPLFYFPGLRLVSFRQVGSDLSHLKLTLDDPDTAKTEKISASVDAIAFKKGHLASTLKTGSLVDLVASLDLNTWANRSIPQLMVKEISPSFDIIKT
ncbi:single-stranded-DNA-specific exonuclease RecJ [Patescibacteria group bacterium]|nr:single-stranded-DNA-specific exonuclease RecJ [Patescibacteria group bacterium]